MSNGSRTIPGAPSSLGSRRNYLIKLMEEGGVVIGGAFAYHMDFVVEAAYVKWIQMGCCPGEVDVYDDGSGWAVHFKRKG